MKTLASFVVLVLVLFSYMILSTRFGLSPRYPVVHYLLALGSLAYMMRLVLHEYGHLKMVANLAGWFLFGVFAWWTLSLSEYSTDHRIVKGVDAGIRELTLRDSSGMPFPMMEELGRKQMTLLVFYRGYW